MCHIDNFIVKLPTAWIRGQLSSPLKARMFQFLSKTKVACTHKPKTKTLPLWYLVQILKTKSEISSRATSCYFSTIQWSLSFFLCLSFFTDYIYFNYIYTYIYIYSFYIPAQVPLPLLLQLNHLQPPSTPQSAYGKKLSNIPS